jgi:hypothetical protein
MNAFRHGVRVLSVIGLLVSVPTCRTNTEVSRLVKENQDLRQESQRLTRELTEKDKALADLQDRVAVLTRLGPDRPLHVFAPTQLEIASLSGGADYDGKPGDDGVTLYLRPRDADGDVVKVPGNIQIQLVDNTQIGSPRVVAVCIYDDLEKVREMWLGKFLTQHFSVKCPFPPGVELPPSRKLQATAEFTDVATGRTLTAVQEVSFTPVSP